MNIFNFFKKKEVPSKPLPKSTWRNNMWVMTTDGIGILFTLGDTCEVHLVNEDGSTKLCNFYPLLSLRQAFWNEIPASRRGINKETANGLGYK
jgi:hypothetical protein